MKFYGTKIDQMLQFHKIIRISINSGVFHLEVFYLASNKKLFWHTINGKKENLKYRAIKTMESFI